MDVIVCYVEENVDVDLLGETLEAWAACDGAFIKHISCKSRNFEVERRVAADSVAESTFYLLVDVGCVPTETSVISTIAASVNGQKWSRYVLLGLTLEGTKSKSLQIPTGVRICRKGAVTKWPAKVTRNYDREHAEAVRLAGEEYTTCPDIFYKRLPAPLFS